MPRRTKSGKINAQQVRNYLDKKDDEQQTNMHLSRCEVQENSTAEKPTIDQTSHKPVDAGNTCNLHGEPRTFQADLAAWAVEFSVPIPALGDLLQIIKTCTNKYPNLPTDPETLLRAVPK